MRVALVQSLLLGGNVEGNLEAFGRKLSRCRGHDLVLLPEMFASGCLRQEAPEEAVLKEREEVACRFGEIRDRMLFWAGECDAVVAGSAVCREGTHYYNRLVVAFPDGHCLYYDKRHLFRPGGEGEYFSAGERPLLFEFRGMKMAAFICYDLRFPVWCRNVRGYDLAFFVANWPEMRREAWEILLKARAVENQAFVAGVNCVGTDVNGLRYAGGSMLVDARGKELTERVEFREGIFSADCDPEGLRKFRERFPVWKDRDHFDLCQEGSI